MQNIRLSIVIPAHLEGQLLHEAIERINLPKNEFCEIIVISDRTKDDGFIDEFASLQSDRFSILNQESIDLIAAKNNAITQAKGDLMLFLDSATTLNIQYLEESIRLFDQKKQISVLYSDKIELGKSKGELSEFPPFSLSQILTENCIGNTAIIRKSVFEQIGNFDLDSNLSGNESWEFWIRCATNNLQFENFHAPLFQITASKQSKIAIENNLKAAKYVMKKYAAFYQDHFETVMTSYLENIHQKAKIKADFLEENQQIATQNEKALQSILKLQTRVNQLESTNYNKVSKSFRQLRNRFKTNSSSNTEVGFFKKIAFAFGRKGRRLVKKLMAKIFKHLYLWTEERNVYISEGSSDIVGGRGNAYHLWLRQHLPSERHLIDYRSQINRFQKKPKFSFVIPVYNPKKEHFTAALDSILNQVYDNFEICLADDLSPNPEVKDWIHAYMEKDERIKAVFRTENGHISAASNSGLEITTGDYIVLMDQDDVITKDALYQAAKVINDNEKADLIYSDEDKVDDNGVHSYPHFKPDWSPDNLLSRNYLGHLTIFNAEIMKRIGGWREGFEGSQDYDLVLRFTEETNAIFHIPKILYHWRIHETSAAAGEDAKPYAYISAKKALAEALSRRNEPGNIEFLDGFRGYSIRYDLLQPQAKVSIIIPTKDKTDYLKTCIESIYKKSTHKNFEIVVVDNNSEEKEFFQYMKSCEEQHPGSFKCVRAEIPFNFSALVNIGVKASSGEYVILLNNDTEVITPDWMEGMLEQAQRPSIGVVGVKLLYANKTIQHAGVVMGLGGAAGHVLVGEDREGPGYFNYVNMVNNYAALTAACIMVRRDIWDKVNGFDEIFTVEYNDVDFCLRVHELGRRNVYLPHVELFHFESISRGHPHMTKESFERHVREINLLKDRWIHFIDNDPYYNPNLSLGASDFSIKY